MNTGTTHSDRQLATTPPRRAFQFSLRGMLVLVTLVAAVTALFVQSRRLAQVRAALSRYESTQVSTSLAPHQFRIITQTILDTDHLKVVKYRIESLEEHFATLDDKEGDANGSRSNYDPHTGLHFNEVTVVLDHVASQQCVKMLPKVGGAQGYSVLPVKDNYVLDEDTTVNHVDGVYSRNDTVELLQWGGKSYSLSLK